jgi:hypothetical protein
MTPKTLFAALLLLFTGNVQAQEASWLEPADTLHKGRFWGTVGTGAAIYSGAAYGLYQTWYKDYDLIGFHTFNDMREWQQMDKMGHWLTTYTETRLLYGGARWTGLDKKRSLILSAAIGSFLQGTVEVMDGFSEEWGFSWGDIAFNTLGAGTFVAQEAIWDEQRILLKLSGNLALPPEQQILAEDGEGTASLRARHHEIYGTSLAERLLKDYNTMTVWTSWNIRSFLPESKWPVWLNLALGYGAGNMYGGFANEWEDEAGNRFVLPEAGFERYRQFYLSPDIDLTRIPTRKRWLKMAFSILNFVKIPAPALELDTQGHLRLHPLYF